MALDEADKKFVTDLLAAALAPLQEAVKPESLVKTLAPAIDAHVKEGTKSAVTSDALKASLDELVTKLKPAETPGDDKGKGGKGKDEGKGGEKSPELVALEAQIAELTRKATDAENAAKAEREKARTTALHSAARNALTKAGIPEDRVDVALDVLKARGVLAYDGDNPGFKGKNDVGLDAVLPLEKAVPAWVGGEGKLFLPPVGAKGTGEGRGNNDLGGPQPKPSPLRDANGQINPDRAVSALFGAVRNNP